MKLFTSVVLLINLLFFVNLSYAATGSTGYVEIQTIRVGGGFLRVTGVTDFTDPSNCNANGSNKNRDVLIMENTPSYKEILSFVLSAKMSGKKVQFWVNGCETDSGKNYPNAKFIYIKD